MASVFWVGGTGTWDGSSTTHWSTISGGAAGATPPGAADTATFNASSGGGTVTVNTDFSITSLLLNGFTGTLDFSVNNNSPTAGNFTKSAAGIQTLKLGSGTFTLTGNNGSTNPWNFTSAADLTLTAGTSTIKLTSSAAAAVSFIGGGKTYNNIWFARGSSTQVNHTSGNNTFNDFKDDGTAAHSLRFEAGSTNTFTTFTVSGNSGNNITLTSGTAVAASTSTHTLSKSSGTVTSNYLNISHSIAQGGATWNAVNSVDNNSVATAGSGWIFVTTSTAHLLSSTGVGR